MVQTKKYVITSEVWLYPGHAAWHFIGVPKKIADKIKKENEGRKIAWGSIPVTVAIGKTTWKTSLFPDSKSGGYLLPLKAEVRKKENIFSGDRITLTVQI